METFLVVLISVLLLAGMAYLHRNKWGFTRLVFLALVLGIGFGVALQLMFGAKSQVVTQSMQWLGIVGNGYISLLQMLVIPLIFVSLVGAFTQLKMGTKIRKIAFNVLAILLGTTAVASLIGYSSVALFGLEGASFAKGMNATSTALTSIKDHQSQLKGLSLPDQITAFFPQNIFADFAGMRATSTIAVVIFSLLVGLAFLQIKKDQPKLADTFAHGIEAARAVVMKIVKMILQLTPYGIFALIARTSATNSFASMAKLVTFILAAYLAVAVMFIVHAILLMVNGINPITYFKKAWPVLVFAFTSRTSGGSLPLNVRTQKNSMGVSDTIADFSASFGLTIGQNGCAGIYPSMVAAITAPLVGINIFSWQFVLTLIAIDVISSFGVAGVGGGATFTTLMVLGALNLPVTVLGILIAIDPVVDMARTALNVNDSMIAGVITAKRLGELDWDDFQDKEKVISSEL
ncbi:L-cystine transporter [uncultured Lactobacillus sp.]|uniref:L-cystine transporter n=1 Tax=uncultured Lactobacillus sp. TaxID=153152 RepID=UPI00261D3447|nr:cation:dicarboxylase symporter family transporter [uncultured Lactobacillus sp.]